MIGDLNETQIDQLLHSETVGRIGCHAEGRTYVVPITYVYDGKCIYGHSGLGVKIEMMRENPEVCFEVDHIQDLANWQSVIAWANYKELAGTEADKAKELLIERLAPLVTSETSAPKHGWNGHEISTEHILDRSSRHGVIFRLTITEKTGRYEKR